MLARNDASICEDGFTAVVNIYFTITKVSVNFIVNVMMRPSHLYGNTCVKFDSLTHSLHGLPLNIVIRTTVAIYLGYGE